MNIASLEVAIVYVCRASIRPVVRQELKAAGINNLVPVETPESCIQALAQMPHALLVVDWDHGPKIVNNVLRAAQSTFKTDTRPIFLIAAQVSMEVIAVGTEYNVSRLLTGEISRSVIHEHVENIVREESDAASIRSLFLRVAEARARGELAQASQLLAELHARFPDNLRITCELADNLIQEDRWSEAHTILEQAKAHDQQSLRSQHLIARCLMKMGRDQDAAAILERCKLINPFNIERLLDLGHALLRLGEIRTAARNFEEVLELDGTNTDAMKGTAQCRLAEGDVNEALVLLRQLSGPQELASIFNNAAILSIRQGRFDAGLTLYKTALGAVGKKDRLVSRLLFNLGIALTKNQRMAEALQCFERAVTHDRFFEKAQHNASVLKARLGRVAVTVGDDQTPDFEDEKVDRIL